MKKVKQFVKHLDGGGHEAFSCDIQECSGGHPEWHINGDVLCILNGRCSFKTEDGLSHIIDSKWDLIIAHPPCTYLTVTGNRWFNIEKYGQKALDRISNRKKAVEFFMCFVNAECDRIAIENPVGFISTVYKKPDQIIQPYEFGHPMTKKTCLWLKNLPKLIPTNIVEPEFVEFESGKRMSKLHYESFKVSNPEERSKIRSKTFDGIATAMAEQWGSIL